MPMELISIGPPLTLIQNTIYALPATRVFLHADTTTGFQVSNVSDFATFLPLSLSTAGHVEVSAGFIRNTIADVIINLKKF